MPVLRSTSSARRSRAVWYPFHHDFAEARRVQYGISLAHALATHEFRLTQAAGTVRADAKIGLINCFTPPYTKENPSEADLEAVRIVDGIDNRWWLDLVTKGEFPQDILDDLDRSGIDLGQRPGDEQVMTSRSSSRGPSTGSASTTITPQGSRPRPRRRTSTATRCSRRSTSGRTPS